MSGCRVSITIFMNGVQMYSDSMAVSCDKTIAQFKKDLIAMYKGKIHTFELNDNTGRLKDILSKPTKTLIKDLLDDEESSLIVYMLKGKKYAISAGIISANASNKPKKPRASRKPKVNKKTNKTRRASRKH